MARHAAVSNFALWFEVIAGVALLAVAFGVWLRDVRCRSRETPFRSA